MNKERKADMLRLESKDKINTLLKFLLVDNRKIRESTNKLVLFYKNIPYCLLKCSLKLLSNVSGYY